MTTRAAEKQQQNSTKKPRGRPFVKGQSGNPKGRPPSGMAFTELLRDVVASKPDLVHRIVELAESEDENVSLKAIQYIANRLDGMPKQAVETEHKGDVEVTLKWT